jgi:hypothetical protein
VLPAAAGSHDLRLAREQNETGPRVSESRPGSLIKGRGGIDLLNQNQGVNITNSPSYIQKERIESLGRHRMMKFIYRLGPSSHAVVEPWQVRKR